MNDLSEVFTLMSHCTVGVRMVCGGLFYFAGRELDKTKLLSDYSFANDQQYGMLGQNLNNLVFVHRQIGGFTSSSRLLA